MPVFGPTTQMVCGTLPSFKGFVQFGGITCFSTIDHFTKIYKTSKFSRNFDPSLIFNRFAVISVGGGSFHETNLGEKGRRRASLPKAILWGTVDGSRRCRGRPHKSKTDNIKEWTGQSLSSLLYIADDGSLWVTIAANASAGVIQTTLERHGCWLVSRASKAAQMENPHLTSRRLSIWSLALIRKHVMFYNYSRMHRKWVKIWCRLAFKQIYMA